MCMYHCDSRIESYWFLCRRVSAVWGGPFLLRLHVQALTNNCRQFYIAQSLCTTRAQQKRE